MIRLPKTILVASLVFNLICPNIIELPEFRPNPIPPKVVADCLSHLGRYEMEAEEADMLWHSILQFFSDIVSIPEKVLSELECVSIEVLTEEFDDILLENIDILVNFGLTDDVSADQLKAIAKRVREYFGSKRPEDYTYFDLVALKKILCAFKRREMYRIHPKVYEETAGITGYLRNCNLDTTQGCGQLAIQEEDAFGSPATWTNATVCSVVDCLPDEATGGPKIKLNGNISND